MKKEHEGHLARAFRPLYSFSPLRYIFPEGENYNLQQSGIQFPNFSPFNYSRQPKSRKVRLLPGENVFIRVNAAPRVERDERGVTLINIYPPTTSHYRDALNAPGVCHPFETLQLLSRMN